MLIGRSKYNEADIRIAYLERVEREVEMGKPR